MNAQSIIEDILNAHQTNDLCRSFKNEIYNDLNHLTQPYKDSVNNFAEFFMQFFKWAYKQNSVELWQNANFHLYKSALFFCFSENNHACNQSDIAIKKLLRIKQKNQYAHVEKIADFINHLYKIANQYECYIGKSCDWFKFWESIDEEFFWNLFQKMNFKIINNHEIFHKEESYEDIEDDDDDYVFDELKQEYLLLTEKLMPSIKNVDDLNGILWCDFESQSEFFKTYKPAGLLDKYVAIEQERFYFRKFDENLELDKHVYYAIACDMIRSINYNDLIDNIFDIGRAILTASEKEQEKCIKNGSLDLCKHQEKLLRFFFTNMKKLAVNTLIKVSKDMQLIHNVPFRSYNTIKHVVFNSNRNVRNRLNMKKIIDKMISNLNLLQ